MFQLAIFTAFVLPIVFTVAMSKSRSLFLIVITLHRTFGMNLRQGVILFLSKRLITLLNSKYLTGLRDLQIALDLNENMILLGCI